MGEATFQRVSHGTLEYDQRRNDTKIDPKARSIFEGSN